MNACGFFEDTLCLSGEAWNSSDQAVNAAPLIYTLTDMDVCGIGYVGNAFDKLVEGHPLDMSKQTVRYRTELVGTSTRCVTLWLSDTEIIRCTPDQRLLRSNKTFAPARYLRAGDMLMGRSGPVRIQDYMIGGGDVIGPVYAFRLQDTLMLPQYVIPHAHNVSLGCGVFVEAQPHIPHVRDFRQVHISELMLKVPSYAEVSEIQGKLPDYQRPAADASLFERALDTLTDLGWDGEFASMVTVHPLKEWICTDTPVGLYAYYLEGRFIALSMQRARKEGVSVFWASNKDAEIIRDLLLRLNHKRYGAPQHDIIDVTHTIDGSWLQWTE